MVLITLLSIPMSYVRTAQVKKPKTQTVDVESFCLEGLSAFVFRTLFLPLEPPRTTLHLGIWDFRETGK